MSPRSVGMIYCMVSVGLLEREGEWSLCLMNQYIPPEASAFLFVGDAVALFCSLCL